VFFKMKHQDQRGSRIVAGGTEVMPMEPTNDSRKSWRTVFFAIEETGRNR
jgi:hypothetical protein